MTTSVVAVALGKTMNGVCSRGVAHGASYSMVAFGSQVTKIFLSSPLIVFSSLKTIFRDGNISIFWQALSLLIFISEISLGMIIPNLIANVLFYDF